MSRPLHDRLMRALRQALITALAGFGLSALVMTALFGQVSWALVAACVTVAALVPCLLRAVSPRACAVALFAAAILAALGFMNIGPLSAPMQGMRAFVLYPDLTAAALPPYRLMLNAVLSALITALCALLTLIDVPTLTLLPMAMVSLFLGSRLLGQASAPALIGTGACTAAALLAFAEERVRTLRVPIAVLSAAFLLAWLFVPRALPDAPRLRETAETVYQTVADYLPASDEAARSGFTLETEGYLPLGSESTPRLGGAASPTDRPIMEVQTDTPVYLRGVTMDSYTGLNWEDTLSGRRYLYSDLLQQAYRRNIFDEYLPLTSEALTAQSASVHMLSAAATTLYVPQRLRSLELRSSRMTPYFNAGSELFLTRELAAGDGYAFTYLPLPADSAATARMVDEAAQAADTRYAETAAFYTALPGHLQRELYTLSALAAAEEETPYRRALAIRDYLRTHYTYDLDVPDPPENVDFVSWFLLGDQRGYCTYFATALTVLCRMQGIPARYVTGYLAVPENGLATVTSADAHAWTEIYLNGFGWLTLDATPGDHGTTDGGGESPTPHEDGATPAPTPTPTPPAEAPAGAETPTPAPEPLPEATATPVPEATEEPPAGPPAALWIILLAVLVVALMLAAYTWLDPARRAARHPQAAADILMNACLAAYAMLFRPRRPGETLIDYFAAAEAATPDVPLSDLAESHSAGLYGRGPTPPGPALRVWREAERRLSFFQRVRVLAQGLR